MKTYQVVDQWKGRDGNLWRTVRITISSRVSHITQRMIASGVWV